MGKPGRNDPCPCGSGRKYKLCCGTVAVPVAAPAAVPSPTPRSAPANAAAPRHCGGCTKCCEGWVEGEIRGHRMHPGQVCHFLAPGPSPTVHGACRIYAERPQSPCRNFVCAWLQPGSDLPEAFRPDRIGVIAVGTQWRGAPALILVSAGNDPDEATLAWMRAYAQSTRTPFFYADRGERLGYGPPEFQREMAAKVSRGEPLW